MADRELLKRVAEAVRDNMAGWVTHSKYAQATAVKACDLDAIIDRVCEAEAQQPEADTPTTDEVREMLEREHHDCGFMDRGAFAYLRAVALAEMQAQQPEAGLADALQRFHEAGKKLDALAAAHARGVASAWQRAIDVASNFTTTASGRVVLEALKRAAQEVGR